MTWRRSGLHVILALSVVGNIAFAERYWKAREQLQALTAKPVLAVGDAVSDFSLTDERGRTVPVALRGRRTVLYVASSTCKWCTANREGIRSLATKLEDVQFVAMSIDGTKADELRQYNFAESMPFAYLSGAEVVARSLKLRSTPTTIVISPNGIVERVWEGAYYGKVKAEIEHTFGFPLATLPEIAQGIGGPQ